MEIEADGKFTDWVEQAALENIRSHIKSGDDIKREGNIALSIIIAGAAGSLAYTIRAIDTPSNLNVAIGAAVLSVYLFVLCAILVIKCLKVGDFPAPTNEPKNLNQKKYTLQQMREAELNNIQHRINAAARINVDRSQWLNRIWIAATASPLVFGITLFLSARGHLF